MPDAAVTPEAVRLAMLARADALLDRPDPVALSDERLTRLMLEAAAPLIAAAERERLLGAAGCPSPACPDRELAGELFKTIAFTAGPRTPVPHGTWLRESYGTGSVVCEECGRLAADSIEHEHLAGIARDHAAATAHQVIVRAARSALYGPRQPEDARLGAEGKLDA